MSGAFAAELAAIEGRLSLPYPERSWFLAELAADLEGLHGELLAAGLPPEEARREALRRLELGPEATLALEAVHRPAVQRFLSRLPDPLRDGIEASLCALGLSALTLTLLLEAPVMLFLREGGFSTWLVLGIGLLGLLLVGQRLLQWFVLRNHSAASLGLDTPTPLYLAFATLGAGLMGTALDYYVVLMVWAQGKIGPDELQVGLREPLPPLILGASLATLTVLLHGAAQAGLRTLKLRPA